MQMNKCELSKVKGGKIVTSHQVTRSPDQKVSSHQVTRSPVRIQTKLLSLFFLFLFVFTGNWKLETILSGDWKLETGDLVFADSITIRTIVTPIGSQSEKWGAKGLMVCVGGETIPNGGCGTGITGGFVARKGGSLGDVDEVTNLIEVNDIVIFEDTADGSSSNPNHQYDYDSGDADDSDVVYEVWSSSGDYVSGGYYGECLRGPAGLGIAGCDIVTGSSRDPILPASCNHATIECECPLGFTRVLYYANGVSGFVMLA